MICFSKIITIKSIVLQSCQLFLSVAINQGAGIDYHVVLAQNALQHALDIPELQNEMICCLIKQTSRHTGQKLSTSAGVQVNTKKLGKQTRVSSMHCFFILFFFTHKCFNNFNSQKNTKPSIISNFICTKLQLIGIISLNSLRDLFIFD